MRIVIVGEDAGRAGELEESLGFFGQDWNVSWLAQADAALSITDPVDVFLCGLRPGGLPGTVLLSQLAALHPQAVRILLLDQDEDAVMLQGLDCAHRLLSRPLDAGELIEAVDSVAELRQVLGNEELKQTIGRIGSLPPPPRLYLELSRLLRDPDASNAAIAQMLSQDPAIAAKVLRLCNSAYFSGGREITDIRAAVTRLGHQTLLRLVLASEAFGPMHLGGKEREAIQDRSLRTSRLARRLLAGPSAELAATAGLLAEVGRLLPGVSGGPDTPGPHYAEAGAYLLGLWGLPMPIVEGVAFQHRPGRLKASGFWVAGAVHVASALVADTPVDEAYLRNVGVIDKLPQWRDMVEPAAAEAA